ncbi:MAG: molybdopterin cofactor-binding domain-containing protein [Maritimibacter sp.]
MGKLKTFTRRAFLVGSVAVAGGVAFGAYQVLRPSKDPLTEAEGTVLNPFVVIDERGVTVIVPRAEMGQGVQTTLAAIVAEELEVDLADIRIEHGPPGEAYANPKFLFPRGYKEDDPSGAIAKVMGAVPRAMGMQITGGSTSVHGSFDIMQMAGATAREVFIEAASKRLNIGRDQLRAEGGKITATDGTSLSYSALAEDAATLSPPKTPALKSPSEWRLLGKSLPRLDQPAKATGTAPYAIDVRLAGMKFASLRMTPRIGGTMNSFDATPALAMEGVEKVVDLGDGIAVVANNTWTAMRACEAVDIDWGPAPYGDTTEEIFADINAAFDSEPNNIAKDVGSVTQSEDDLSVEYRAPFLAHASMEPMTAAALYENDSLTVWSGIQGPIIVQKLTAQAVGLKPEQVTVHTTIMGGSFGRRGFPDYPVLAARIAKEMPGTPLSVTWSREEDMRHDYYRPGAIAKLSASLTDGKIDNLKGSFAAGSVMAATMKAFMGRDMTPADPMLTEGCADQPYAIENAHIAGYVPARSPRVGFWRSVGASQNAFFWESFVDEMAAKAQVDPLEFRLRHVAGEHAPSEAVLTRVAEMADWGNTPAGRARGIALTYSFGTPVAEIVEISQADGAIKLENVWIATDVGQALDPANVQSQMIGACILGLSAAIHGEITFDDGEVVEGNFPDYDALRMPSTPTFEVDVLSLGGRLGGVGEPGTPPAAAALANAIFALTGQRIRQLPLRNAIEFA